MPKVIIKDKKDIKFAPSNFLKEYEWESHGQYDSLDFVDPDVEVLSVQFTKVGDKTYKAYSTTNPTSIEFMVIGKDQ